MKKTNYFLMLFATSTLIYAQQASNYFPQKTGLRWEYKMVPVDSANNEIDSLTFYRHDLFYSISEYNGKVANIILNKFGPLETIYFQPYLDSVIYHFDGSIGYEHFKVGIIKYLFIAIDSVLNVPNFSFVELLNSLERWYPVYRFAQTVGDEYTIHQVDTTVTIGNENIPLRFEYVGKRLDDEMLVTGIGTFECKKFVREIRLSVLVTIPPFPTFPVPLAFVNDTVWLAPEYWILKGVIPTINIDLREINPLIPPFSISGLITKIDGVTSIDNTFEAPKEYQILQNYPNPFNPSTRISWQVPVGSNQTLKIYDVLGNEVATLVDEYKIAGTYEVEWNASGLPSGFYFYQLITEGFVETKKMILIK